MLRPGTFIVFSGSSVAVVIVVGVTFSPLLVEPEASWFVLLRRCVPSPSHLCQIPYALPFHPRAASSFLELGLSVLRFLLPSNFPEYFIGYHVKPSYLSLLILS